MEKRITFSSADGHAELEGWWETQTGTKGVVICHPHPLYGGNMNNPVVLAMRNAYRHRGYTTLRFNFRGTGKSLGQHDHGRGEQQDLLGALAYLEQTGLKIFDIAGYSFGAWVGAHTDTSGITPLGLVMVSPPVAFMQFSHTPPVTPLKLVVAGENDDIGPLTRIQKTLSTWSLNVSLITIPDADHFYSTTLDTLEAILVKHL